MDSRTSQVMSQEGALDVPSEVGVGGPEHAVFSWSKSLHGGATD